MEGLQANVFRCHGDLTEKETVRMGPMRSSALQVRSERLENKITRITYRHM